MNATRWAALDDYVAARLVPPDPALEAALADAHDAGLPPISVSALQGKLLQLLAELHGAQRILELGTLAGYSTIWLARALPPTGRLISLELNPAYAEVARRNIDRAGLADRVEIRIGPALDSLGTLAAQDPPPFDLVFIDADKERIADYLDWALRLTRPGALILADNVVRHGAVLDETSEDPRVHGVRRFFERAAAEPRLSATVIQTVGSKGYDGFALARVLSDGS